MEIIDPSKSEPKSGAEDFDWVSARAGCTGANMFNQLRLEAQRNVETRNAVAKDRQEREIFSLNFSGDKFSVARESNFKRVDFVLQGDKIVVSGDGISRGFVASVTLSDPFAFCRLKVNDQEYMRWEVLKKALEDLFF